MTYRPRIAITRWEKVPGENIAEYHRRVIEAGSEPLDLCVEFAVERGLYCVDILAAATGLILTGGVDVDPALYGEAPHPRVKRTDRMRDEFEIVLLQQALAHDLPVLAICRGHQLLNVALGGGLLQHIEGDCHRADYGCEGFPSRWHEVSVREGSRLHAALGLPARAGNTEHETRNTALDPCSLSLASSHGQSVARALVNSRHHQAVTPDRLAPCLEAVAFSPDGLVEGMESTAFNWVVGVQWHPERPEPGQSGFAETSALLFAELVRQARCMRVRV